MISTFGCNNGLILAGRARLLRHGARRPVLPRAGELNAARGARPGGWCSKASGRRSWCCRAPSTPATGHVRQSVQQPARLRHLGGADLLHPDDRRRVPAACDAARRRAALQGVRLSGRARALHRRGGDHPRGAVHLPDGDDVARPHHRAARRAGVSLLADGARPTSAPCRRDESGHVPRSAARRRSFPLLLLGVVVANPDIGAQQRPAGFLPDERVLLDAHNCYPVPGTAGPTGSIAHSRPGCRSQSSRT